MSRYYEDIEVEGVEHVHLVRCDKCGNVEHNEEVLLVGEFILCGECYSE